MNSAVDTLKTVADSLQHSGGSDSGWILHHIVDGRELDFTWFKIHIPQFPIIFGIDLTPTKHVVFMLLSALLMTITFIVIARSYKKSLVPKGVTNFFEVFIIFVRDEIAQITIGKGYEKFVPYLLTVFFFILFGNFLWVI